MLSLKQPDPKRKETVIPKGIKKIDPKPKSLLQIEFEERENNREAGDVARVGLIEFKVGRMMSRMREAGVARLTPEIIAREMRKTKLDPNASRVTIHDLIGRVYREPYHMFHHNFCDMRDRGILITSKLGLIDTVPFSGRRTFKPISDE